MGGDGADREHDEAVPQDGIVGQDESLATIGTRSAPGEPAPSEAGPREAETVEAGGGSAAGGAGSEPAGVAEDRLTAPAGDVPAGDFPVVYEDRPGPLPSPQDVPPLPPDVLRRISEEIRRSFPDASDENELVLMDVDPRRVHAYWTLNYGDVAEARRTLGEAGRQAAMVLRFYAVADGDAPDAWPGQSFDVEVQGLQSRHYVDVTGDGGRYFAEVGLRAPDGSLISLARSDLLTLPRFGQWAEAEDRIVEVGGGEGRTFPEAAFPEAALPEPALDARERLTALVRGYYAERSVKSQAVKSQAAPLAEWPKPAVGLPDDPWAVPGEMAPRVAGSGEPRAGLEPVFPLVTDEFGEAAQPGEAGGPGPGDLAGGPSAAAATAAGGAPGFAHPGHGAQPQADHVQGQPGHPDRPHWGGEAHGGAAAHGAAAGGFAGVSDPSGRGTQAPHGAGGEFPIAAPPDTSIGAAETGGAGQWSAERWNADHGSGDRGSGDRGSGDHGSGDHGTADHGAGHHGGIEHGGGGGGEAPAGDRSGGHHGSASAAGGGGAPAPLESIMSLSSFALGRQSVNLEINAELHIYGRSQPGTELTMFGQRVTSRPDGSFSIRRPLPSGALVMPMIMASGSPTGQGE